MERAPAKRNNSQSSRAPIAEKISTKRTSSLTGRAQAQPKQNLPVLSKPPASSSVLPRPLAKPSDRLTKIKTANPFASTKTKQKTNFGYAYTAGTIPCRINHGCNFNKI